jgi:predicted metal-binding membrane protein
VSLEALIRRDRAVAGSGLAALAILAWAYLLHMSAMDMGGSMAMPVHDAWTPGQFLLTFAMWVVMMIAMMVPSAGPMILTFATINRRRASAGGPAVPTAVFVAGYLAIWSAFSLVATLGQWALGAAALMSPATLRATPVAGGVLLLAAGLYQVTPLKRVCLARCRSPIGFVLAEWRDGPRGALVMGIRHGAFCVGCCWALMALLFVAGVMNLLWVAAIAGFVLLEKVTPPGRAVSWAAGAALLAWGAWVLVQAA